MDIKQLVQIMPKAELHLHIEGTLEPQMLLDLAAKNDVQIPYGSLSEVQAAYEFEDLQSFLDIYYAGASVLLHESDFFDLMYAYLKRCQQENIVHAEIMFDPQTHLERGVSFDTMFKGYQRAIEQAEAEWGQSASLIMCFLRHLSEDSALEVLELAKPYQSQILSIGLDSSELGHPPEKFKRAYAAAAEQGYRLVAHAGEEGDPSYIWGALDELHVERIDHGVRCLEDKQLVERLVEQQIPLTVCPLSNVRLCVYETLEQHPILNMLEQGLVVTVNSDDPPYFGGYLTDNFLAMITALDLNHQQAIALAKNSIKSAFIGPDKKEQWLDELDALA